MSEVNFFQGHDSVIGASPSRGGGEQAQAMVDVLERLTGCGAAADAADPMATGLKLSFSSIGWIEQARATRRAKLREAIGASFAGRAPNRSAKTGASES